MLKGNVKRLLVFSSVATVITGVYLYARPVPRINPLSQIVTPPKAQAVELPWPAAGQAAYGASGYGVLQAHNTGAPASIASIAKVITALAVLQQKPLAPGQLGPVISIDATDLEYFNYYYLNNGSSAKVEISEKINEYQALQAMLLPSANNFADSLARWAFGSNEAYSIYANKLVKNIGLAHTSVGGPSGFADDTTSTANDLVKLGIQAMANPVIAEIVGQPATNIPVAGDIKNVNWLLGTDGVVGIKTGNTDKAGGCYLFAAKRQIQGHSIVVVGAMLGATDLKSAISAAQPLLASGDNGFSEVTVVRKNQVIGNYTTPWGNRAKAVAAKDVKLLAWRDSQLGIINRLEPIATPAAFGSTVGKVIVQSGAISASSSLVLSQPLSTPPWTWRLFH